MSNLIISWFTGHEVELFVVALDFPDLVVCENRVSEDAKRKQLW
jgi:hypothetical protein